MAALCYGLLLAAWIIDFATPQLFIAAILFNGPIALSSLALRKRLTNGLVIAAEIGNIVAGYVNGVQAGHHWDGIAIGDRLLLAASYILVGYLSNRSQEYAREAGASAGRMRQVEVERALRAATVRVRETLNVELVQRAITRESAQLIGASKAMLVARESAVGPPLIFSYSREKPEITVERRVLPTEIASLVARTSESGDVLTVSMNDALGRLTLASLNASEALATPIRANAGAEHMLLDWVSEGRIFTADAITTLRTLGEQAAMALEQARLFTQLGERNDEIDRQKNELAQRSAVIRDIVYALAHDLRTPLAAQHVTMNQALAGAYGQLSERYREVLTAALSANDDVRRIVETLLLVARYEAGEASTVRRPVRCRELIVSIVAEFQPMADVRRVELRADVRGGSFTALGDPYEIRRAIVNLVANALDATPCDGRVTVRCSASKQIEIAVEDDGYGIPPERRAGLFQRFGGHFHGGIGLGLYIVRRIVEKHGGAVGYAPRQPRGSIFTMTLPLIET